MATIPAASPSSPSMRLMAFDRRMTQATVTRNCQSGDSTNTSPVNGSRKKIMVTPNRYSTLAASTWPASFAGGDTSRMSSSVPTSSITAAATTTPMGSDVSWKISENCGIRLATPMATAKPRNMATPPSVATGRSCTWRSSGSRGLATAP